MTPRARRARGRGALGEGRRIARVVVALAAGLGVILALVACGPATTPAPSAPAAGPTLTPTLAPAPSDVPSPVEGVVIDVEAAGLTDVRAFTIRTDAGDEIDFALDLEDETLFPPAHLAVHLADGYPVVVHSRVTDGVLVAFRIEDGTPTTLPSG